ncbi:hypothetical protein ACTOWA_00315 [Herbaspirillum seropedicae]|uniref:hypothetical protein n=1 Tax=Herbaspirillum seropedicae TaxID=964 RepID=UPI00285C122C|nr:hypothetical protein [Herbaspirillum seropedicae]MDR6397967.1 hypothetical protein [Herbaspirillum seropedicae]
MEITKSNLVKLTITGAPALDPIGVFLEDIEPGKGKVVIECAGDSWTAYWSAMGKQKTVAQFISATSADYLVGCMVPGMRSHRYDPAQAQRICFQHILKERRRRDMERHEAKELWITVKQTHFYDHMGGNAGLFQEVFGDEWWYSVPESPNPSWTRIERVMQVVIDALRWSNQAIAA